MAIDQSTIAYNTAEEYSSDEEDKGGYGGGIYEEG